MQWHPIFARLLRPLLEDYYEVQIDVPVGDLPRQADIVLLRRLVSSEPPFHGIWRHLTVWNVFEFKGPTDDPALRDLDLLWEVALGIERRLNEERARQREGSLDRGAVSWWYLANHIGRRFRTETELLLGQPLQELGPGLWHCSAVGRMLFLVSRDILPVERERMPLHLVTTEDPERASALAAEIVREPKFWGEHGNLLATRFPHLWREVIRMSASTKGEFKLDFVEAVRVFGLDDQVLRKLIAEVGLERIIQQAGSEHIIPRLTPEQLLSALTPEQIAELKKRLP